MCIACGAWLLVIGTVSYGHQADPGTPATRQAGSSYWLFESGQVRPLALSRDGKRLYAVNTPDNRLEIYGIDGDQLSHQASVTVGLWVYYSCQILLLGAEFTRPAVASTLTISCFIGRLLRVYARRYGTKPGPESFAEKDLGVLS
jgi:hypothetical protein